MGVRSTVRRVSYQLGLRKPPATRSHSKGTLAARAAVPRKREEDSGRRISVGGVPPFRPLKHTRRRITFSRLLKAAKAAWGNAQNADFLRKTYEQADSDIFSSTNIRGVPGNKLGPPRSIEAENVKGLFDELAAQQGRYSSEAAGKILARHTSQKRKV